jgi:hypothetical protein
MNQSRFLAGLLVFFVLLVQVPSWADEASEEPRTEHRQKTGFHQKIPSTTGPIITDSALPQAKGTASVQIGSFLAFTGGNFSPDWQRISAAGDFLSLCFPVDFYYGIASRTEIQISSSYIQNWASNAGSVSQSANFGGIGDSSILLKYLFVREQAKRPAVSGLLIVGFPTGHHRRLNAQLLGIDQLGTGAFSFTAGVDIFKYTKPFLLYANIWYTVFTDANVNSQRVHYPDQVTLNVAVELPLNKRWVLLCELVSTWDAGRLVGTRANQPPTAIVSVLPALEFLPTLWFNVAAGLQVDLIGKNTSYTFTPVVEFFINF